jgi:hypothetical protein
MADCQVLLHRKQKASALAIQNIWRQFNSIRSICLPTSHRSCNVQCKDPTVQRSDNAATCVSGENRFIVGSHHYIENRQCCGECCGECRRISSLHRKLAMLWRMLWRVPTCSGIVGRRHLPYHNNTKQSTVQLYIDSTSRR